MRTFKLVNLEVTRFIKNKRNFAVMMLLPIVFVVIFSVILNCYNKDNFKKLEVGLVNLDDNNDTKMILSVLEETPSIKEVINFNKFKNLDDMLKDVNSKNINCGIMIPSEFINSIYDNNEGMVSFYSLDNINIQTMLFKNLVFELVDLADYMRNSLDTLWESMKLANIPYEKRMQVYEKEAKALIMNMVVRDSMFNYENSITIYIYYAVYFILVFMYVNLMTMYRNMTSAGEEDVMQRLMLMNYTKTSFVISKGIVCIFLQLIVNFFMIGAALLYLRVDLITALINVFIITLYNGIFVATILNILPNRNFAHWILISILAFMIFNANSNVFNPLNKSMNMIFDTLKTRSFVYYRSTLLSIAAMILINILIVIMKKYSIFNKEGVFNEKMS